MQKFDGENKRASQLIRAVKIVSLFKSAIFNDTEQKKEAKEVIAKIAENLKASETRAMQQQQKPSSKQSQLRRWKKPLLR